MKQQTTKLPRAKGEQKINERGSNSVEESGAYGGATLHTPGTHAPSLLGPNTKQTYRVPVTGIEVGPNSKGAGGTFQDGNHPAPGVDFGKFKGVAAKAKANLTSKTTSKTITESDTAGPQKDFVGMKTGANRALAKDNPYNLAKSYDKKGAHGRHRTAV